MEYNLFCLEEFDYKWSRVDLQVLFNSVELNELWGDLIEKGELVHKNSKRVEPYIKAESAATKCDDIQEENRGDLSTSSQNLLFSSIFNSWVWRQKTDQHQVQQCLDSINDKQNELFNKSCSSILTLLHIKQQLLLVDRCYKALQRDKICCNKLLLLKESLSKEKKLKDISEPLVLAKNPNHCLAIVGSRAILHFAFAFLKRAWRSGEDGDLCSDLLEETLSTFYCLPPATFFNEANVSEVWAEVIGKSKNFFRAVAKDDLVGGNNSHSVCIPVKDRQMALSLYLELSLLQGSLTSLLDAVLFLLQLSAQCQSQDSQKNKGIMFSPLVSLLRRLSKAIEEVHGEGSICRTTHNISTTKNSHLSVSKNFLKYLELPAGDHGTMSLKDAAIVVLCYLDSCASKYLFSTENCFMDPVSHQEIVACGDVPYLNSYSLQEIIFGSIGNEVVTQIVCSRGSALLLTNGGMLYTLPLTSKCKKLQRITVEDEVFTLISSHREAEHFLCISSEGLAYSWGEGCFGQLGHGHENTCLSAPSQIKALAGKFVIKASCSALYSAFITSSGELYICGGTSLKLLSDDVTIPMHVVLPDKVVDVACETMDSPFVVACSSGSLFTLVRTTVDMKTEIRYELCANVAHIEVSKIFSASKSLFAVISKSGKLHLWNSSCEASKLINSLSKAHSESEGIIALNFGEKVVDVSFTSSDIVVLLESGRVVSWGEDDATQLKGDGYFIDGVKFQHLNLSSIKSWPRFVGICCSNNHCFAWTLGNHTILPDRKEFLIDLRPPTFDHLNQLLSLVFDSICGYSHWPPSQDEECLAVASLNLLNLQLRCATRSSDLGEYFFKNVDLASSLKQKVISLASCSGVLSTIQGAAQATLLAGWQVLMPSHEERVRSLSTLLHDNNVGEFESKCLNTGGKFMIRLLVDSLMMKGELEESVDTLFMSKSNENSKEIISLLAQQPNSKTKSDMINMTRSHESTKDAMNSILQQCPSIVGLHSEGCKQRTPDEEHIQLLDLIDLLFRNAVSETLARMNISKKNRELPNKLSSGADFTRILLKFQRIFFSNLLELNEHDFIDFYSGSEVLNASLHLKSYMSMTCTHFVEIFKSITNVRSACELISTCAVIEKSFVGLILPEAMLSLLLLQTKNPSVIHFADLDECLTSLLEELNNFTLACPKTMRECDEMMWERFWAHDLQEIKEREQAKHTMLRQSDLENMLKEGILWTRDNEKAYDMNKLSTLLGMGDECWKEYIGRNSSEILEPGLHNKETLEKFPDCVIGLYAENATSNLSTSSSIYMPLAHSLRMLALMLGMQAKKRSISTSISDCEVKSSKWMKSSILTGGLLAMRDIFTFENDKDVETSCLGPIPLLDEGNLRSKELYLRAYFQLSSFGNVLERETLSRNELGDLTNLCTWDNPDFDAQKLQDIINICCNNHSFFLPISFPTDHPIWETTRFITAVLIKHLNLWSEGLKVLEVNSNTNQHAIIPDSIANVCRIVCHVKKLLIKIHQDSGRSYKEVCSPILERCRFLLHEVGPICDPLEVSPEVNSSRCRWEWATMKVLENLGKKITRNFGHEKTTAGYYIHQKHSNASLKEISKDTKSSADDIACDFKNMKDSTNMDKEGGFHSFQHSLRYLDSQSQLIVRDIMEFLLHSETINLELLKQALLNQNVRASIRMAGLQSVTSLLHSHQLSNSCLFYILLGWQGALFGDSQSKSISCLSDVHLISQSDKINLEQAQEKFNSWVVCKLRDTLKSIEAEVANYSGELACDHETHSHQIKNIKHKQTDNLSESKRRNSLPVFPNHHSNGKDESMWLGDPHVKSRRCNSRKQKMGSQVNKRNSSEDTRPSSNKGGMSLMLPLSRFVPLLMTTLTSRHSLSSVSALINSGLLALIKTSFRIFVNEDKIDNKNQQHPTIEKDFQVLVDEFLDDREAIYSTFDGPKMASVMKIGSRVVRGPNWNWGNQDGPQPGVGTLVSDIDEDGWVLVKWDSGTTFTYRMGKDNKYDLMLFEGSGLSTYLSKTKEEFHAYLYKKSLLSNSNESTNPLNALFCNIASNLANSTCLNVLLESTWKLNNCAAARLANHLKDVIDLTYSRPKDETNTERDDATRCLRFLFHGCCSELNHWSGYGFVRSISSNHDISTKIVQFCWIQRLLDFLTDRKVQLLQKLQILLLLESILPHFNDKDPNNALTMANKLIEILGNLALECSYDQSMKNNDLFACRGRKMSDSFHLLSSSHTSTIAEQLRSLLVSLFGSALWTNVLVGRISQSLDDLAELLSQRSPVEKIFKGVLGEPSQRIIQIFGVLSFLGGIDESKLRLGGRVNHGEFGDGTISGININGDVSIQFDDFVCQKSCYYKELTVIQLSLCRVVKNVMNESMIHQWAKLLYFAFCSSSNLKIPEDLLKWGSDSLGTFDSSKQREFIRTCQLKYFLLKASRIVFSEQQVYRKMLSISSIVVEAPPSGCDNPNGDRTRSPQTAFESSSSTRSSIPIFQHVLQLSTQPSPILPIYNSHDLELALTSLFQSLSSGPWEEAVVSPAWRTNSPVKESGHRHISSSLFAKSVSSMDSDRRTQLLDRNSMLAGLRGTGGEGALVGWNASPELMQRLVDMGFKPDKVRHALNQFGPLSSSDGSPPMIEPVITWLLDNCAEEMEDAASSYHEMLNDNGAYSEEAVESNNKYKNLNFLVREDFMNLDLYAVYVKSNVRVGMVVRCCESYEDVKLDDIGIVQELDNDDLHDLNVRVDWMARGGSYWVGYIHLDLNGEKNVGSANVPEQSTSLKIGDCVRVKDVTQEPFYGWGLISHASIGIVTGVSMNGEEVTVNFSQQSSWNGLTTELERVLPSHMNYSNYHNQVERNNFDFPIKCESRKFGSLALRNKSPNGKNHFLKLRSLKKPMERREMMIYDWKKCVKSIQASSREDIAQSLFESVGGFWESSGSIGKHWIRLEMHENVLINQLRMTINLKDSSYIPSFLVIIGGLLPHQCNKELATIQPSLNETEIILLENVTEFYRFIEIQIRKCNKDGIDCRIPGMSIAGKLCFQEAPLVYNHLSYLASDSNPGECSDVRAITRETKLMMGSRDIQHTYVFVWGLNDKDQLGGPRGSKIKVPVLNEILSSLKCIQIAGGSKSLFCVTQDGKLYVSGEATNGRLGLGITSGHVSIPRQLISLSQYVIKKVAVHSGGRHAMALTVDGKVFSWGEGDDGKLGHFNRLNCDKPKLIEALRSKRVRDIACGSSHSAAIISNGDLYTWGLGEYGRLGHGDSLTQDQPKLVTALVGQRIIQVSLGSRDAQTLALTDEGLVYSWGDGDFGKLGRGGSEGCNVPMVIDKLSDLEVCQVECGAQFSLALTKSGQVWTWGKGDYFRLGHGTDAHVRKPQLVEGLKDKKIVHVAVGALHCLAVTDAGKVYAWGDNDHGQQGNGTTSVNKKPALVHGLERYKISKVSCGSSHSLAWCVSDIPYSSSHEPVAFSPARDPLGTSLLENEAEDKCTSGSEHFESDFYKPPSLSKIVMSLETRFDKLQAVMHLMRGLQISYARNAIIEALKPSDNSVFLGKSQSPVVQSSPAKEDPMSQSNQNIYPSVLPVVKANNPEVNDLGALKIEEMIEKCSTGIKKSGNKNHRGNSKVSSKSCPELAKTQALAFKTRPTLSCIQSQLRIGTTHDNIIEERAKGCNNIFALSSAAICSESQERLSIGLDDFTRELSVDDSRMIVDLLKIATAGRLHEKAQSILSSLLNNLAKSNPLVSEMLMELCVTELEDVSHNTLSVSNLSPVMQESPHPYTDNSDSSGTVRIPGATSLRVEFDRQCSTERRHDHLSIMDSSLRVVSIRSGRELSNWVQELVIGGDELHWRFKSDGSVNGWGWRFTVYPTTSKFLGQDHSSDRTLISRPSIHLVMCLLDLSLSHPNNHNIILRLAAALATCSQIGSIAASQKIWILQKLRTLMISHFGRDINVTLMMSSPSHELSSCPSLIQLVKSLPETLLRQFEYEDPIVRSGKQLMFSRFFKVLVGLACDLGLDSFLNHSEPQNQRWNWFHKYCQAKRVSSSLQERSELPANFCEEVMRKIRELSEEDEMINRMHESHGLFTMAHDEQLLQWLNRKPDDWVLTSESSGQIWVWGHNHRGQLGGVEGAKIKVPIACEGLSVLRPVHIAGGEQTLFSVTADGKVYASGYGAGGRLGIGGTESVSVLTLLESIQHVQIKKLSVNSGGKHCLALTSDGDVFSWGEGEDGKLGHGTKTCCDRPRVIETLRGKDVIDVAAGGAHSACISARGELFTWGKGRYGRLGHGDGEDQLKPKLVEHLRDYKVIDVACGSGDAQTLCLTSDDSVWSWGDGDYGKLGRGGSEGCKVPMRIESLQGLGVIKVECGSQFSVALTRTGSIYTWGKGDYHRLGHGTDDHVRKPKRIMSLQGKKVIAIACGSLHCVCCTDSGEVYTWGDNDEGQLGDGTMVAIQKPRIVASLQGKKINKLACGSAHSFAWSSNKPNYSGKLPQEIPMEFNLLQNINPQIFRKRLILLHHFSDILCPFITMVELDALSTHASDSHVCTDVLRSLLASSAKESIFKKVVQATMVRDKPHGPVIEINRIQVKRSRNKGGLAGIDGIKSVFGQICSKMADISADSLMLPHRVWKVKFIGESVDDCGGGYSESITEICDELQNGSVGILIQTPNGRDESGSNRDCFILNPSLNSDLHKNMFKFFGMLLGIAIRTGSPLNLNLAEPIWKQLVGQSLSFTDLDEIDRDFVPGLMRVKDMDDDLLKASEMPFSTTNSAGTVITLSNRFQKIDSSNKDEYISLALSCRLLEFNEAVKYVREGMSQVVPVPLLNLFTGLELETMVCGSPDIPVNLLKSVATYKGIESNTDLIHWFWEVMEEFTDVERSLFLRFVWGRTRLPRTIADFRGRDFVIQVLDRYDPPDSFLPESYTCFFLLKMPRYSSKKVLKEKLKYAIHFCKSIDTDDYARIALTSPHLDTESSNDEDGPSCNSPSEGATSSDED